MRINLLSTTAVLALLFFASCINAQDKPDFLLILADDMNLDSVGVYGCSMPQTTPNIDALAREGRRYDHAHVASTACQPSRVAIATGRIGHRSGGEGFHRLRFKDIPTLPRTLKEHGYFVGIVGKVSHSTPYDDTPWDKAIEVGRDTKEIVELTKSYIATAKEQNKPYCILVNSHDPHRPYFNINKHTASTSKNNNSVPSKVFSPEEMIIPNDIPDVEATRYEQACYFSSVRRFDDVVGGVLGLVDDPQSRKNTMVAVLSDHGIAKPTAKSNIYPQSTKTPLILRMEGVIPPGVDSDNFISSMDLFPTILELASAPPLQGADGISMLPLFKGDASHSRHNIHTQYYSTIGKKHFQMRCFQDKNYAFIYNAWYSGKPVYKSSALGGEIFKSMVQEGRSNPHWKARAEFILTRTPEEFYDLRKDPFCQNNLFNNPEYKEFVEKYRAEMLARMKRTKDYILPLYEGYLQHNNSQTMREDFVTVLAEEGVLGGAPEKEYALEDFTLSRKDRKRKKKK
ncbi:MAG: sulfatase [Planctomycetes bacterium]|nr:sulfatase [Planctomycetota bacterium]